jgi:amidase
MHFSEYIEYDAVGLAHLIKSGQVSAQEVQLIVRQAILTVNPALNALVGDLFEESLPSSTTGPFAGVPFVIKDLVIHAAGVKTDMGSRLT